MTCRRHRFSFSPHLLCCVLCCLPWCSDAKNPASPAFTLGMGPTNPAISSVLSLIQSVYLPKGKWLGGFRPRVVVAEQSRAQRSGAVQRKGA